MAPVGYARCTLLVATITFAVSAPRAASAYCRSTACRSEACQPDESGCPRAGAPLWWASRCIGYSLSRTLSAKVDREGSRAALRRAFATWAEVPCEGGGVASLTFAEQPEAYCSRTEYNANGPNIHVVYFQDDLWQYLSLDNTLAKTTVTFSPSTGEIYDADIAINSSFNEITLGDDNVEYDLQAVITHEVGHFIGLGHSDSDDATMHFSYTPGSTELRSLSRDDIAAVCDAYPPKRDAQCAPTPRGGFTVDCGDTLASTPQRGSGCGLATRRVERGAWALGLGGALVLWGARRARRAQ
jgi:hypothetical protein